MKIEKPFIFYVRVYFKQHISDNENEFVFFHRQSMKS